jgi:hypothetical protein
LLPMAVSARLGGAAVRGTPVGGLSLQSSTR